MAKRVVSLLQLGAQMERDSTNAIIRRLRNRVAKDPMQNPVEILDKLLKKLEGRPFRFNKKPGGLGK